MIRDLSFDYPEMGYLVFLSIVISFLYYFKAYKKRQYLDQMLSIDMQRALLLKNSPLFERISLGLMVFTWILATVALMGPKGNEHYPKDETIRINTGAQVSFSKNDGSKKRKAHDVIFLIDASLSMSLKDTRNKVGRLNFAQEITDEIISQLEGERVAVYTFTSVVTPVAPLTFDYLFSRLQIKDISINEGGMTGTDFFQAIEFVKQKHFAKSLRKATSLIILSDGGDTQIEELQGEGRSTLIAALARSLGDPLPLNLQVFLVGIGSKEGSLIPGVRDNEGKPVLSKMQEDILRALSEKSKGKFYDANRYSAMSLASEIVKNLKSEVFNIEDETVGGSSGSLSSQSKLFSIYDLYFQLPLGCAIICLFFEIEIINRRWRSLQEKTMKKIKD